MPDDNVIDQARAAMPIFSVSVTCSHLVGGTNQQNSLDTLLYWSAAMTPEQGLMMLRAIQLHLHATLPGAFAPVSESAAKTREKLKAAAESGTGTPAGASEGTGKSACATSEAPHE